MARAYIGPAVKGRRLIVGRTLHEAHGRLEFISATKTDGPPRVVSLPTFLANMIAARLDDLPADPNGLLFTSPAGRPVQHGQFVRRVFKPAVRGRPAVKARLVPNGQRDAPGPGPTGGRGRTRP